ncbi:hypothetical protein SS1G_03510 [Sclerotinia sclerotiorum 1980 UF-70]|uniref:Uncharacterized protein n=1 Tax=Sclerotinia sclerotiorum (strain ATCC 18683 / 1980 / Ss-1) TaxID=665079 RepID=A7EDX0_SCLS1|nr:hypothetical protein SS1G_03510 [Sclerotinia sclerotiorum 1980 UF-70]EDO01036.1 hypothetical protein SS1G_03510 [Sclerotinia sclerotiorum 1980 UF-70]
MSVASVCKLGTCPLEYGMAKLPGRRFNPVYLDCGRVRFESKE